MPTKSKSKPFSSFRLGHTFYRKVGGSVFKMVKASDTEAVMYDDAPASMKGRPTPVYRIPVDELMLDEERAEAAADAGKLVTGSVS